MKDVADPGRPNLSRTTVNIIIACYFLLGLGIGYVTKYPLQNLIDIFHNPGNLLAAYNLWYYDHYENTWEDTTFLGVKAQKFPPDMWVYQEILYETKPDVIVEAGTYKGGSALYFASMFDLLKHGRVITIDIVAYSNRPEHPRITYLIGSSTSDAIFKQVRASIRPGETVMVSLDSDHHKEHVLQELRLYSSLVTVGNYLVVEDTELNGHPVMAGFGPGPMEAVQEFLTTNSNFVPDRTREKFGLTVSPNGWLKRVR